jgi:hypothetical protein
MRTGRYSFLKKKKLLMIEYNVSFATENLMTRQQKGIFRSAKKNSKKIK